MSKEKILNALLRVMRHFVQYWKRYLITFVVLGALVSSCEVSTPWGVLKKGGINLPWSPRVEKE